MRTKLFTDRRALPLLILVISIVVCSCTKKATFEAPPLADTPLTAPATYADMPEVVPAYGVANFGSGSNELTMNVEAEDERKIKIGEPAVAYQIPEKKPIQCRVSKVFRAASGETGQSIVWLTPATHIQFKPGEFYYAVIQTAIKRHVLTIPREAVFVRGGHTMSIVRKQTKDGKAAFDPVEVKTGITSDAMVEITDGLEAGGEVTTQGGLGFLYPDFKTSEGD